MNVYILDASVAAKWFTEEENAEEALSLLGVFRDRGGFILSSGCEIPPESRPENVAAMVNAASDGYGEKCRS